MDDGPLGDPAPTSTGERPLWGWLEALCTPPKLPSCSWSSRLPTLRSRTGCTPHCRPEQLPQPDFLLPREETFLGRTHSQRAVSEGTRLGQIKDIAFIPSSAALKQNKLLLSKMQSPSLPFGAPRLLTLNCCSLHHHHHLNPHPTPIPVLSQRCLNVRSWADEPGYS